MSMEDIEVRFTFTEAGDGLPVNATHLVEELEAAMQRYCARQDGASMAGFIDEIVIAGTDYTHLTFHGKHAAEQERQK